MSNEEKRQGAVHATKDQAIEFRDLEGNVSKTLSLDELETNTEHLLFALFFNQMEQLHHLQITSASAVATLQLQTTVHEMMMSRSAPDIDATIHDMMDRVEKLTGQRLSGVGRSVQRPRG